jgi:hypothetical protein
LLVPMSQKVATTRSPTFWHEPGISFKNCTSISALVLPWLGYLTFCWPWTLY